MADTLIKAAEKVGEARIHEQARANIATKQRLQMEQDFAMKRYEMEKAFALETEARQKSWELEKAETRSRLDFEMEEKQRIKETQRFQSGLEEIEKRRMSGDLTDEHADLAKFNWARQFEGLPGAAAFLGLPKEKDVNPFAQFFTEAPEAPSQAPEPTQSKLIGKTVDSGGQVQYQVSEGNEIRAVSPEEEVYAVNRNGEIVSAKMYEVAGNPNEFTLISPEEAQKILASLVAPPESFGLGDFLKELDPMTGIRRIEKQKANYPTAIDLMWGQ